MRALRRGLQQNGDDFPELLEELRTYLGPAKPGQQRQSDSGQGSCVPVTLLGSSDFSARLAATLGPPFAFAAHFAPDLLEKAAHLYRTHFRPGEVLDRPWLMVGVQVIAAESDAAARRLFTTPQQRFLRLIRNHPVECCLQWTPWTDCGMTWSARQWRASCAQQSWVLKPVKEGLERLVVAREPMS